MLSYNKYLYSVILFLNMLLPFLSSAQNQATLSNNIQVEIDKAYSLQKKYPDSALNIIEKVIENLNNQTENFEAKAYNCKGRILLELGKYEIALTYFNHAIAAITDSAQLSVIINNKGNAYNYLGDFKNASLAYLNAIEISKKYYNSKFPICNVYFNLCTIFDQLQQKDKLQEYLEIGLNVAYQKNEIEAIANFLMLKAMLLVRAKDFDHALIYLDSSIDISRKHNKYISLHSALSNKGHLYLQSKHPQKALESLLEAAKIMQQYTINKNNQVSVYASIGDAYLQLNDITNANKYFNIAWSQADDLPKEKMFLLGKQSEMAFKNNQFKKAYQLLIDYHLLKDSLHHTEVANNVNELETKYRTSEKDKAIAESNAKLSLKEKEITQKNYWLVLAMLGVFIGIMIIFFVNKQNKQKLTIANTTAKANSLQASIDGELKERHRFSRELHDGVNSNLTGIAAHLEALLHNNPQLQHDPTYNIIKNNITIRVRR